MFVGEKSGHVGLGERWKEKGKKEEEGGGAGVCLQGCVMQPGRFSPCCDQQTEAHPKNCFSGACFAGK